MVPSFLSLAIVVATAVFIFSGVKIVPQGSKFVIQRLGKFYSTLNPGLNFIIPFVDSVSYKVTTKDIVLDIPTQEVITRDNAVIITNAVAYINIVSPEKAVYGVDSYVIAIQNLVQTSLRAIIGQMSLDDALSSREMIKAQLKENISDDIADWGIVLKTVEIQDIQPSNTMQKAMEEQAAAERQRRAKVTKAEGDKAAAILEAQGQLEASKLDAEAQIVLADASREAIERVAQGAKGQELPIMYLLGEKYIQQLGELSTSANSKTLLLPGDLQNTVKGLFGK